MARVSKLLPPELLSEAEKEYSKLKDGRVAKKLLAIMSFFDNTAEEVSKIFKISPKTLFRWLNKFREKGLKGLEDSRGGNYPCKLSEEKWEEVKEAVLKGKDFSDREVNWTLKKVKLLIKSRWGIEYSEERVRTKLREMGLVLRRPRVKHYKTEKKNQEEFKKNERKSFIK